MQKSNSEMENWHMHRGKGMVFAGFVILAVGLMNYYQLSWTLITMVVGVLLIVFGFFRMMK
ncbi:MAG: hypothetical protein ABSD68_02245 [Candidatus Micrarchaeales archaeon]